ncbi:SDR family oxidoreductase [Methyloligella sp. 2.7D]|uniref:SDR family NAD(P)-dependent oxidoreductase n=1 Tax=unclassified Methyloligella TaxID=2625955 RepID=UPI00157E08E9|nr:SDR family oxidoreductase [Methyloligella sp. GL2]QKP77560.1 SDR family oxidoreductase [Methyloligella sp. GL2]
MDFKLNDKRAFVSGSTQGIGYAIAKGLAEEGADVVINGRRQDKVDAAVAKLKDETGGKVSGVAGDLGTAEGVDKVVAALGDVDILVNNAGIFEPKPVLEITDADWQRFFDVNVMSGIRLTRALLPAMLNKGWGRVIFISSESGQNIPAEMVHYGVTKTAQLALTRGFAESFPGSGVTVNAVLPGPTRSEGVVDFLKEMGGDGDTSAVEADFIKQGRPTSIIQRFAEPEEVANMVVYLCSEAASATTGAPVRVEGGLLRSIV